MRNVKPASGSGEINLVNAYWSTLSDQGIPELDYLNRWLTMSRMNSLDSSNQKFVDQAMLRIENTSTTEPLQIFDLQISDTTEFDLPNGEDTTVPLTIPAGGSYDLLVEFIESSGGKGVRQRTLTITSSAKNEPVAVVTLAGAYMTQPEGGNEVTADHIAESFGLSPDSQGRNLIPLSSDYTARYEEVLSYRWQRADTSQPMYVHQIAAFHGGGNVGFNVSGSGGDSHGGDYHQSLLPATTNTTNFLNNPTQQLFNSTNSTFTFTAAGYSTDDCEGVTNCNAHGMRLWPLYNPDGELIPNTYYAIQDYVQGGCGAGSANCDYNDNVYLITNLAPVTMPPPDLQIALATEDEQVAVGQSFDYTLTVSNETIFNAENVTVTDTLPAGFTLVVSSFGNNETCAESGGTVTCDLGTMAGKSTVEITLTVSAANEGINIANVASVDADDFGGASSETVWVTVVDPDNLPGSITVILDADPDSETEFTFNNTMDNTPFVLIDDGSAQGGDTIQINFNEQNGQQPSGYELDFGEAFGDRGNSYNYGWVNASDGTTPLDLTANGRDRGTSQPDQRLDTLVHMQGDDVGGFNGTAVEGFWEITLPNGFYEVTAAVGDPDVNNYAQDPELHALRVEGVTAIQPFAPQGSAGSDGHHQTATVTVEVTDGRLTLDAIGGTNSKINYVDITPQTFNNQKTFATVLPGEHDITEVIPTDWDLTDMTCNAASYTTGADGVTIDLQPGEDVTCTFTNEGDVTVPLAIADIPDQSMESDDTLTLSFGITPGSAGLETETLSVTGSPAIDFASPVTAAVQPDTYQVTFSPDAGDVGTYTVTVFAEDFDNNSTTETFTLTVTPDSGDAPCAPISTLPCDQIATNLPFSLDWDGDEGGLDDSGGTGTGFSMAMAPSSRLSADDPVTFPGVAEGYEPSYLTVADGNLAIDATKGIFYRDNGTSSNTNSQLNGLGVGVNLTDAVVIETTVTGIDFTPGGSNAQQGGIWFGLDEDNVAKLVVFKTGDTNAKIQLQVEDYLSNGNIQPEELNTGNIGDPATLTVTLRMVVDPTTGAVTGFYSTDGTTFTPVIEGGEDTLTAGTGFLAGDDHDGSTTSAPLSYAGVFSTIRNDSAPITFNFADFSIDWLNPPTPEPGSITIVKDTQPDDDTAFDFDGDLGTFSLTDSGTSSTPVPDGDPIVINFQLDTAPIPDGFLPDTGAAYGDRGNSYTYGWLDFTGDVLTGTPVDASTAARDRNRGGIAQELDTIMHMQRGDVVESGGWLTPVYWEIALPNGFYDVTVSVGDEPGSGGVYDSQHQLRLEGTPLFNAPQQLDASQEYVMAGATVEVTDGVLTMDPLGGFNTKPTYIEIQPLTTPAAGQTSVTFNDLDAGSYVVTELASTGWQLDDVTCTGDVDNGSALSGNTLTVDLDDAEDIVCTFVNIEAVTNTAPEALAQSVTVDENDSMTITLQGTDVDTGDTLTYAIDTPPSNGTLDTSNLPDVLYTPDIDYVGSDSFDFVVNDGTEDSAPATVSITVEPAAATPCAPISTLPCDQIAASLPFSLDWDGDEGGLDDSGGMGTGFSMAMAPSSRLSADDPVTFPGVAEGYEPRQLTVANGNLSIEATKGIFYRDNGTSSNTNSQLNGLGVGVSVTDAIVIETTVSETDFTPDGNNSQQGGIWFGLDEDNVAKLVVAKTADNNAKIQLQIEDYLSNGNIQPEELNTGNIGNPVSLDITLRMVVDPATGAVTGFYSTDGTTFTPVIEGGEDTLMVGTDFFAGDDHDADAGTTPLSYAGVFSTIRNGSTPITFNFADFSIDWLNPPVPEPGSITIVKDTQPDDDTAFDFDGDLGTFSLTDSGASSTPVPDGDPIAINFQEDGAPIPADFLPDTGAAYGDRGNSYTYGWLDFTGDTLTDAPIDASAAARDRNRGGIAQELDTLIHMQLGDVSTGSWTTPIYWEIELPNGFYEVTVSVGDQPGGDGYDSQHQVRLEGSPLFNAPQQLDASQEYATATATVEVTDGVLTMDPLGGFNTKPNYIEIQPLTTPAAGQPSVTFDDLDAGSYAVTELASADWQLDDVTCTGDLDNGSTLSGNTLTVDLDEAEDIVCTFVNVEAPTNTAPEAIAQSVTVDENGSITITLQGTDADTGDTLSYTIVDLPDNGSITSLVGNQAVYEPSTDYVGSDSFDFVVNDGTADSAPATVSITVEAVNTAPQALAQSVTVDENGSITITLQGTDADTGDTLSYAITNLPDNGSITSLVGNQAVYQPSTDYVGSDSFDFVVNDGTENSAPATVSITVEAVDTPPALAAIDDITVDEGELVSFVASATDDNQALLSMEIAITDVGGSPVNIGTFTDNGNGLADFIWQTDSTSAGVYTATVTATDDQSNQDTETLTITVNDVPIDEAPILASISDVFVSEGQTVNVSISATDDDEVADAIALAVSAPTISGYSFTDNGNGTASFSWTTDSNSAGTYTVNVTATDDGNNQDTETFTIYVSDVPVDEAPQIASIDDVTVDEGELVRVVIDAQDFDQVPDAISLTLNVGGLDASEYIFSDNNGAGVFLWATDSDDAGTYPVTVTATDTGGNATQETFQIIVNNVEVTATPTPTDDPGSQELIRINAGGPQVTTESGTWSADIFFSGGVANGGLSTSVTTPQDEIIYLTERSASSASTGFNYAIPVNGTDYTVKLHFAEIWFSGVNSYRPAESGQRVFDVEIEGQTALDDLDIIDSVGTTTALVETFDVTVTDGTLNINFPPAAENRPQIAGIEVIGDAVVTPEPTETATLEPTETETSTPEPTETSTPEPTETETSTPEPTETATPEPDTVIRINTGGLQVTTESGVWSADTYFVGGQSGATVPNVTAAQDEAIYLTERSATSDNNGFAYAIPVSNGTHTLRLHFAEIWFTDQAGNATGGVGKRVFDVQIEGQTQIDDLDIYATVGSQTAHIETFTVQVTDGVLNIDFPPASSDRPQIAGIEVIEGPTSTPEPTETETETSTPEPTETETSTPEPTVTETETSTPEPTETETETSTPEPTETETETSTPEPTETETETSTPEPTETETETSTPEPTETAIRINAGGPEVTTESGTWSADTFFTSGVPGTTVTSVTASQDEAIYLTERSTNSDSAGFAYAIPVSNGTHTLRLHFAEIWYTDQLGNSTGGADKRVFDVQVEGQTVIDDLDIYATVGSQVAHIETFTVTVTDGVLDITFPPASANRPQVAGIEVLSTSNVTPEPTETETSTPEPTETETSTPEPTETETSTPEPTETETSTPEPTETETSTPEPTETETSTPEPTETETETSTPEPTETETSTPEPTETETSTPEPTETETETSTPEPTETEAPTPAVVSFTLIDAENDTPLQVIGDGSTINLSALPTTQLNIRADVNPAAADQVGSVSFTLSGAETENHIENIVPYALFWDFDGDYQTWTPTLGTYTLQATPHSSDGASGTAGTSLTVNFTIIDTASPSSNGTAGTVQSLQQLSQGRSPAPPPTTDNTVEAFSGSVSVEPLRSQEQDNE